MRSGRMSGLVPAAAAVGVLGGGAFLWRVLTWQSAVSPDAWAYTAWGQAVARGERPLVELSATTPKPLGTFLGLLVAPLPPDRGFAVVVALSLGALAAFLFAAAYREGGAVAAAAAVVALALGAELRPAIAYAFIDVVTAALIVAGVAFRGRLRIVAMVLAGLLRPEAWALAAFAGFTETAGSWRRRAVGTLAAGAAAPVLWSLSDLLLTGDPLGTMHWRSERHSVEGLGTTPWADIPGEL
jgi:pimeloyl-ACP methyl ester carboxylesterase